MAKNFSYSDRHIREVAKLISQQYNGTEIQAGTIHALINVLIKPKPEEPQPEQPDGEKTSIDDDGEIETIPLISMDSKGRINKFLNELSKIVVNNDKLTILLSREMKQQVSTIADQLKGILYLMRPLVIDGQERTDGEIETGEIEMPQRRIEDLFRKLSTICFSHERSKLEQANLFSLQSNTLTFYPAFYRINGGPKKFINMTDLHCQTPGGKEQEVTTGLLKERLLETVPKGGTIKRGNRPSEDRLARINGTISKQEIDHEKFLASLRKLCGISGLIYEENI